MSDRKAEILEQAQVLVQKAGYDCLRYQDIADELGVTRINIHHHFPHKEDLGNALLERLVADLRAGFDEISREPGSSWEKLDRFFDWGRQTVEQGNRVCPISAMQGDANVIPDSMQRRLRAAGEMELEFLTNLLEEGRERGEMAFTGESASQAEMVLSAHKGALMYARMHGPQIFAHTVEQLKASLTP